MLLRRGLWFVLAVACLVAVSVPLHKTHGGSSNHGRHRNRTVNIWTLDAPEGDSFQFVSAYVEPCMGFTASRDMKGVSGSVCLVASDAAIHKMRVAIYADMGEEFAPNVSKCLGSALISAKSPKVIPQSQISILGISSLGYQTLSVPALEHAKGRQTSFHIYCTLKHNRRYWVSFQLPGVGLPAESNDSNSTENVGMTSSLEMLPDDISPVPSGGGYALLKCASEPRIDKVGIRSLSRVHYRAYSRSGERDRNLSEAYTWMPPLLSYLEGDL